MTLTMPIRCFEPTLADHALLVQAQILYERTLPADERIPWIWIERSAIDSDLASAWRKHLILATINGELAGFAYGAFLPGFGGYLCYVTVDERFRKHGVGTRLYDSFFAAMRSEAASCGEPLDFVLWESHHPGGSDLSLWNARLALFAKVGGRMIDGLELMTPNYSESSSPVPLTVFLKPMDKSEYTSEELRAIAAELLERVYVQEAGDPLFDASLGSGSELQLI